jgi:hypothetical protein
MKILACLLLLCQTVWASIGEKNFSLVFVHIGKELPGYVETALRQAHLFNPDAEIILIGNQRALENKCFELEWLHCIACETIQKSKEHQKFIRLSVLDRKLKGGLFYYATERFFYLDDLMQQYRLKNVFHLENDVMLYANLEKLLPIFVKNYKGLALPFENEAKGLASFVFIANQTNLHQFIQFLVAQARSKQNEMYLLGSFKNQNGQDLIEYLPNLMPDYLNDHLFKNVTNPARYCTHLDQFESIFDGAAYGQYLGGQDPFHRNCAPGFINPECVYNASYMRFEWKTDLQERKVPYVIYNNKSFRLNNLHIHSKNLKAFFSDPDRL